jgi:hypothetical protein
MECLWELGPRILHTIPIFVVISFTGSSRAQKVSGSRLWFGRTTSLQQPAMFQAAGAIFVRIFCGGSACYLPLSRHSLCSTYLTLTNTNIAFFTFNVLPFCFFVNVCDAIRMVFILFAGIFFVNTKLSVANLLCIVRCKCNLFSF